MAPTKVKQEKSAQDAGTSSENTVGIEIPRDFFKKALKDRGVKRILMKRWEAIGDLIADDKAVLCPKKQEDKDTTLLTVMDMDDIVEDMTTAEETPEKEDTTKAKEKPEKHPGCPECVVEANKKPTEDDTEADSQDHD